MIKSTAECAAMIDEIFERGDGLSDWESQFVDDVYRKLDDDKPLSYKQREIVDRIYTERVR